MHASAHAAPARVPQDWAVLVSDEHLFTVSGAAATPGEEITLAQAGFTERAHLQEWIVANPEVLGSDVQVVTFEFDRWMAAAAADDPRDRLDVLAIDDTGTLVVVELKRDRAAVTTELQALKYVAMASRFKVETLAAAHAAHLSRTTGATVDPDDALAELEEHAGGQLDTTVLRRPRVVLVAGDFPRTTTATAVWLTEMGVEVTLVRYQAYRTEAGVVLTTSKLWPIAKVDDFTIAPRLVEAEQVARTREARRRATSAVARLAAADALEAGTALQLRPTTEVDADARAAIEGWVADDPARGRATWTGESPRALRWEPDGRTDTPSGLARHIIREATGVDRGPRGTAWWITEDGDDLVTLADAVAPTGELRARFDPEPLHHLLQQLPPGNWTTYKDLADQVGSSAMGVASHLTSCDDCHAAWRVLGADGRPRSGFRWDDPARTETQQEALEAEGVTFDAAGRADPSLRMRW